MKDDQMSRRGVTNLRPYILSVCISALIFILSGLESRLFAQDELGLKREKDRTVYTIDDSDEYRQEQARDKDRAWDMLQHMPVLIGNGTVKPTPVQPAQTAPSK